MTNYVSTCSVCVKTAAGANICRVNICGWCSSEKDGATEGLDVQCNGRSISSFKYGLQKMALRVV